MQEPTRPVHPKGKLAVAAAAVAEIRSRYDERLVYYGPYRCADTQTPRKKGNTGCDKMIVKAGNGASPELEFDAQKKPGIIYPNSAASSLKWTPHVCKGIKVTPKNIVKITRAAKRKLKNGRKN